MEIGKVEPREITVEMSESYLDYAMSVIIQRALPDVRDGMKPVHRRILYSMYELGLSSSAKLRKSATVVGDVLGKFHPHGDIAVYDALARLTQDFSLRYPLIQGQGNWGSIDGDPPAAMRYTECRLEKITGEMLADLEKNTVDWRENYDQTRKEPVVLPARVPQLLLNGTMGIAVGMATSIPPHNLTELVDASLHLIFHPGSSTQDLFEIMKGPDFPTGGVVYNRKEMIEAYSQGRGSFVMRGKADIETGAKGARATQIVITEIPYQVNKATLVEQMAELVHAKRVDGIRDIRDESDKDGMRVAVDLKSDTNPQKVLNAFYKFTDLQKTYHLNMLAIVDGIQPQVLSFKHILEFWIRHRKEVVRRRTEFDLAQAQERAHILEGLHRALSKIDAVIRLIKTSPTRDAAHKGLMKKFRFTERQATAILEMRLQTLAGLERKKIAEELKEKQKLIQDLTRILKNPKRILGVIARELEEVKKAYGDPRRTKIISGNIGEFSEEDLVPEEETIISLTHGNFIKRTPPKQYRIQKRGGKGIVGFATKGDDFVENFLSASTHDSLLVFTDKGKVFRTPVYEIPEASRVSRGRALVNFLTGLDQGERATALVALGKKEEARYFVMATAGGIMKKVEVGHFSDVRKSGIIAINLKKGDSLEWVGMTNAKDDIILATSKGQGIRFRETDLRPMGRSAAGVIAMRLGKGEKIAGMSIIPAASPDEKAKGPFQLLVVAENGFGKRTDVKFIKVQRRGGKGIKVAKLTPKTGEVVAATVISNEEELIAISQKGQVIRTVLSSIPVLGRTTQGVRIMRLEEGDKLASVTCL